MSLVRYHLRQFVATSRLISFHPSAWRDDPQESTRCLHCCEKEEEVDDLRSWLLLLLLPQSGKTNTGNLDDLEANTWNISLGLALASETGKQDLVVLVDEVQATIVWNWKCC